MKHKALVYIALIATPAVLVAGEMELTLGEIGLREYYCTHEMTLNNQSQTAVMEVSGHFNFYIGEEQVGRSKGTWFMNIAPGESKTATFETPNAPCNDVERYEFVVGACRVTGPGFDPVEKCSAMITGLGLIDVLAPGS
ncbi:MAG: hypothetical protein AAGA38_16595 [Pseudomonadota bacterium]